MSMLVVFGSGCCEYSCYTFVQCVLVNVWTYFCWIYSSEQYGCRICIYSICTTSKCSVNCEDYLISVLLKEIFHKGKVLTYSESQLCVRHSAGCFPGSFQGRWCFGLLSVSFLCCCFQNQLQGSDHVFSCFQVILTSSMFAQELCLICVHHPKPSSPAVSLAPLLPIPHCPWCLSNLCSLTLLVYLLWFWDIQHNRI